MVLKIISISILLIITLLIIVVNNKIISKKNKVKQSFGSIEIYLKKRFDLIPNLIATLNKYLTHEKDILIKITELRSNLEKATDSKRKIEMANEFTKILSGMHMNFENYPTLKADSQFINLQFELTDIEDQISAARRAYNACVTDYNTTIQIFPINIISIIKKEKAEILLEIPKSEQKSINVNQLLNQ